jgi:hypothetical protein
VQENVDLMTRFLEIDRGLLAVLRFIDLEVERGPFSRFECFHRIKLTLSGVAGSSGSGGFVLGFEVDDLFASSPAAAAARFRRHRRRL